MRHVSLLLVGVGVLLLGALTFGVHTLRVQATSPSKAASPLVPDSSVNTPKAQPLVQPTALPPGPPPPNPDWVNADGTLNKNKLPPCFHQADQHGNLVKDKDGKAVCIPSEELFGPPPAPPTHP